MSADRPLTDAQERALIALDEYADRYGRDAYTRPLNHETGRGHDVRTIETLQRLGYAEIQERPMVTVARITDEGIALLRSMGD